MAQPHQQVRYIGNTQFGRFVLTHLIDGGPCDGEPIFVDPDVIVICTPGPVGWHTWYRRPDGKMSYVGVKAQASGVEVEIR